MNSGAYNNNSKYDPAYCKRLLEHMSAGCSFATFGALIGVRYKTLRSWRKQHPEWDEAAEIGELLLMYTWEKIIIGQANGDIKGLPATTIFALKNYFPEKFKENTALGGPGNTIVVFDSGVPVRAIENKQELHRDPRIVDAQVVDSTKSSEAMSIGLGKKRAMPDYLSTTWQSSDIITEDDI